MSEITAVGYGPATPEDLALDAEAQRVLDESLKNIRAAAADWAKTIASLTGILGIVALIKGREDISDLVAAARVLVGLFLATGIVFAIRAILLAALAAEGTPTKWWVVGEKLKSRYRSERELAAQQLMRSRSSAVAAAVCLLVAVGIAWYSPEVEAAASPPKVLVTFRDRPPICGDLASRDASLAVAGDRGLSISVGSGNVRTLNVVSSCPGD